MKRKIFCLICCMLLTLSIPSAACAASFGDDLSEWSYEELVVAREAIESEIRNRLNIEDDGELLPTGVYVVGEDILAGKYVIKNTNDKDIMRTIYLTQEDYATDSYDDWGLILPGGTWFFELEDGMVLEIEMGKGGKIYKVNGMIGE